MMNYMSAALAATAVIPKQTGNIIGYVIISIMVVVSIALITVVMMQKSTGEDMSALTGGNSKNDSFFGKNKAKSPEGKLKKVTVILAVCLLVLSIAYFVIAGLSGVQV
jgi:protein translocase, SecG subunit